MKDFYDLQARTPQGADISMGELKGKAVLIVNTATKCGLAPQFKELNFGVTFQLMEKIRVNGKDTHPIFVLLKDQLPGKLGKRIKWNFTKFLITPEGIPFKRYAPTIKPASMEEDIRGILPSL